MFAVGPVLVSDAVLDAPFACALGKCRGACCVQGVRGAPLEPEERAQLEAALPVVWDRLRPAAQATILREGTWERDAEDGSFAVMTVGGNECVFAVFRGGVAKCAIQEAHREGLLAFPKPISCHLYPIRVSYVGEGDEAVEVLNYEQVRICRPAVARGRREGLALADFLRDPLTRKYGPAWYAAFRAAVAERTAIKEAAEPTS